jgi:hypothetical protein
MAPLSVVARTKIAKGLLRWWSKRFVEVPSSGITKYAIYDPGTDTGAVAETDDWIDDHAGNVGDTVGYNGALSQPFRGAVSAEIKSELFLIVAAVRTDSTGELARRIVGEEVD